jgi:hypothetical protein
VESYDCDLKLDLENALLQRYRKQLDPSEVKRVEVLDKEFFKNRGAHAIIYSPYELLSLDSEIFDQAVAAIHPESNGIFYREAGKSFSARGVLIPGKVISGIVTSLAVRVLPSLPEL